MSEVFFGLLISFSQVRFLGYSVWRPPSGPGSRKPRPPRGGFGPSGFDPMTHDTAPLGAVGPASAEDAGAMLTLLRLPF